MSDPENKNPEDGANVNLGTSQEIPASNTVSDDVPVTDSPYDANPENIDLTDAANVSPDSDFDHTIDDGLDPVDIPLNDPADMLLDEEEFGEDAFYDEDMEDIDAFSSEWDESDEDNSESDVFSTTDNKQSVIQTIANNKAIKFGAIGIGGLAAVSAIYIFALGGGAPTPAQQSGPSTAQSGNNNQAVQAALNNNRQENVQPVSLFDSLDNLPSPDPVPGKIEQTSDGQDLGDVFSILEDNMPDNAPDNLATNNDSTMTASGDLNDFALPMPTPISANMPEPQSLDTPQINQTTQTTQNIMGTGMPDANASPNDGFNVFDMAENMDTIDTSDIDPIGTMTSNDTALPNVANDMPDSSNITPTDNTPSINANIPSADLSGIEDQLAKLNNRMDDMGSRIKDLENNKGSSSIASSPDLSRIESTLKRLERRIEDLGKNNNVVASRAPQTSTAPATRNVQPASTPKATAPKKPAASTRLNARNWALRGASPDQAFLAKKSGGSVQTVRVGDRVAGLGTIRFIGIEKGEWVVKTTGGNIRQ